VLPKTNGDIVKLVRFAEKHKISLTPRTAGTSLAGQTVGIIVDVSKHFIEIVSFDKRKKDYNGSAWVIRDELNLYLKPMVCFLSPLLLRVAA
jgi:FAD/FMN-containing dehydrogenase